MRKKFRTATIALAGLGLSLGFAIAAPDDQSPETRAYLGFSFGGKTANSWANARDFHYGLRVDHDSQFAGKDLPPVIQLDFTKRGMNDFRVHGVSAIKPDYRLRQAEEAATEEAPAEEVPADEVVEGAEESGGFFSGIGAWFSGLFGGDEEVVTDEAAATAEATTETAEAEVEEAPAEGAFLGYNAIDWGLVAVGAAGLGFAATEVVDGEDKSASSGGSGPSGPGSVVCLPGQMPNPAPDPGNVLPDCIPSNSFTGSNASFNSEQNLERQRWLDGGTGQMGDLGG